MELLLAPQPAGRLVAHQEPAVAQLLVRYRTEPRALVVLLQDGLHAPELAVPSLESQSQERLSRVA